MRKYDTVFDLFVGICDAIRSKKGTTGIIAHQDIPDQILSIESGTAGLDVTIKYVKMITLGNENLLEDFDEDIENFIIDGTEMFKDKRNATENYYEKINGKYIRFSSLNSFLYGNNYFNNPSFPVDVSRWDITRVWDISSCFYQCSAMQNINLENWDTKNVINFSSLFEKCSSLKEIDLSSWNTSKMRDISLMFYYCTNLSNVNFENWDTKNIVSISNLFYNCTNLENIDISHFNLDNCETAANAFAQCYKIKKLHIPNLPKASVSSMLNYCNSLYDFKFLDNGTFGNKSTTKSSTLNLAYIWKYSQDTISPDEVNTYGYYFEQFANSIGTNTSGLTRTIKLNTNLYNSLSDTQKSLLIDKGYTLTYGTS